MRGLYPIIDVGSLDAAGIDVLAFTDAVLAAQPALLQLRAKNIEAARVEQLAVAMNERCARAGAALVINDNAELAARVGAPFVHLGQDDASPREVLLHAPGVRIGLSTHNELQLRDAANQALAYVALGPIFFTSTKLDAADVVDWNLVMRARTLAAGVPLVCIGGIDERRAAELAPHVDMVAVIGALVHRDMAQVSAAARRFQALWDSAPVR